VGFESEHLRPLVRRWFIKACVNCERIGFAVKQLAYAHVAFTGHLHAAYLQYASATAAHTEPAFVDSGDSTYFGVRTRVQHCGFEYADTLAV
jgi:hypothetical protein